MVVNKIKDQMNIIYYVGLIVILMGCKPNGTFVKGQKGRVVDTVALYLAKTLAASSENTNIIDSIIIIKIDTLSKKNLIDEIYRSLSDSMLKAKESNEEIKEIFLRGSIQGMAKFIEPLKDSTTIFLYRVTYKLCYSHKIMEQHYCEQSKISVFKDFSLAVGEKEDVLTLLTKDLQWAELKIGSDFYMADNEKVINSMPLLTSKDKSLSFTLKQSKPFGVSKITMRWYKLESHGKTVIFSTDLDVSPEGGQLSNEYSRQLILQTLGKGKFELEFLIGNKIIANEEFTVY